MGYDLPRFGISKSVDLTGLPDPDVPFAAAVPGTVETMKSLARFGHLQALSLKSMSPEVAKQLTVFPDLRRLSCYPEQELSSSCLRELAAAPHLRELALEGAHITDRSLKEIAGLKQLESLHLGRTKVTDEGLQSLAPLVHLHKLGLHYLELTGKGLKCLAQLSGLERLYLSLDRNLTDADSKALGSLKGLKYLGVYGYISDTGLKELAGLQQLKGLSLPGNKQVTDNGCAVLRDLANLKYLDLSCCISLTDLTLHHLATLRQLEILDLSFTRVSGIGFKQVGSPNKIRSLTLRHACVSDAGAHEIANLDSLEYLDLGINSNLSDAGIE